MLGAHCGGGGGNGKYRLNSGGIDSIFHSNNCQVKKAYIRIHICFVNNQKRIDIKYSMMINCNMTSTHWDSYCSNIHNFTILFLNFYENLMQFLKKSLRERQKVVVILKKKVKQVNIKRKQNPKTL